MKIVTVSLNPAIDQTVKVNHFRKDTVNRGESIYFEPGGKGINVSIFMADYARLAAHASASLEIVATGLLGRENAGIFEQLFAHKNILDRFIRIPGRNRIGVKIVDEASQETTDINMPGLAPSPEALDLVLQTLQTLAETCQWVVLTGSLPPGVPVDTYARIIRKLRLRGCQVLLDSSGEALRRGADERPAVLKPNIFELEELTRRVFPDLDSVVEAASGLLQAGTRIVTVTMGKKGALFVTREASLLAVPPEIPVKSTVGAGDALVSGLLCGLMQEMDLAACARLASAFALAAITGTTRGLPAMVHLQGLADQVKIQEL